MTVPTFILPAIKNNLTTAQLIGAIGAGDVSIALKADHGALFPTILTGGCSSTGSGILLNDTGALGSVAVGDFIHNLTDGSSAIVTSIGGAPNSVATTPLEGGSDNTWQSGDVWVIGMFIATIVQYDDDGVTVLKRERVKVTNRVTDTLTVVRAYDGDSAQTFLADDYVQILIEKSQIENLQKAIRNLVQRDYDQSLLISNLQNDAPSWLGTVSGTNTLTASATPAKTAYAAGQEFVFIVANNNSGAVTLNVNGLGAKTIKKLSGATDLVTGDLIAGQVVHLRYDGTNMQMLSPSASTSVPVVTLEASIVSTSDLSSSSTSWVDINASLTKDVVCTANTICIISLTGNYYSDSAANDPKIDFSVGGSRMTTNGLWAMDLNNFGANMGFPINVIALVKPGVGTKTIKPQWIATAGTHHMYGPGADVRFTIIKIEP